MAKLLEHLFSGDAEGAQAVAAEIVGIGERFDDKDLIALGTMKQGHALVRQGQVAEGLRLVDETMICVIVAGMIARGPGRQPMSNQRTHYVTTTDGVTIGGTVHGQGWTRRSKPLLATPWPARASWPPTAG